MNKRLLILLFVITGLVILVFVLLITGSKQKNLDKSPQKALTHIDKDTGQAIVTYPNQDQETGGGKGFTILNGSELANFVEPTQYATIADQIHNLLKAKTNSDPTLAKIMPKTVRWGTDDKIHATVKEDSPLIQFDITIKLIGPSQAFVSIVN